MKTIGYKEALYCALSPSVLGILHKDRTVSPAPRVPSIGMLCALTPEHPLLSPEHPRFSLFKDRYLGRYPSRYLYDTAKQRLVFWLQRDVVRYINKRIPSPLAPKHHFLEAFPEPLSNHPLAYSLKPFTRTKRVLCALKPMPETEIKRRLAKRKHIRLNSMVMARVKVPGFKKADLCLSPAQIMMYIMSGVIYKHCAPQDPEVLDFLACEAEWLVSLYDTEFCKRNYLQPEDFELTFPYQSTPWRAVK